MGDTAIVGAAVTDAIGDGVGLRLAVGLGVRVGAAVALGVGLMVGAAVAHARTTKEMLKAASDSREGCDIGPA